MGLDHQCQAEITPDEIREYAPGRTLLNYFRLKPEDACTACGNQIVCVIAGTDDSSYHITTCAECGETGQIHKNSPELLAALSILLI
jgi:hypothetical protein